jgi:poly(beta-D-mannuronate) C5 epimerase
LAYWQASQKLFLLPYRGKNNDNNPENALIIIYGQFKITLIVSTLQFEENPVIMPKTLFNKKAIVQITSIAFAFLLLLLGPSVSTMRSANADCVTSTSTLIRVTCNTTFGHITSHVNNSALLKNLGNGQWLLNVILQVDNGAKLTMSSSDVSWLKISKANGIVVYGKIDILGSKITSWDTSKSAPIQQTSSGSTSRAYINLRGSEGGKISGAEIAFLGSDSSGRHALDLYGSGSSHDLTVTGNSKFHDNWRAFYSSNAYNIVIENSEFYNNMDYTIDPWGGTHDMRVSNVHVHHNKGIGIICSFKCSNITFENNKVHDNSGAGIFFSRGTTNSIMRDNVVYNQAGDAYPILISVSESRDNQIYGNTVRDSEIGITVHNPSNPDEDGISSGNIIHDNTLERVKYAFRALSSAENTFASNTFGTVTGNHYLIGSSASITIKNQKFSNTSIRGMPGNNEVTIENCGMIKIGGTTYDTNVTPYKKRLSDQTITVNSVGAT